MSAVIVCTWRIESLLRWFLPFNAVLIAYTKADVLARKNTGRQEDPAFEQAMLERWPRLTPLTIGLRALVTVIVFAGSWHAIQFRGATALWLLLPMAAEVPVAVVAAILLSIFVVRDAEFRRQAYSGLRTWAIIAAILMLWLAWLAHQQGKSFQDELFDASRATVNFVIDSGFGVLMLVAAFGFGAGVVNDVIAYRRNGPPFEYLGALNFGLRTITMIVFSFWLFCIVLACGLNRRQSADGMWIILLLAEILATVLPAVVQRKIQATRTQADSGKAGAKQITKKSARSS